MFAYSSHLFNNIPALALYPSYPSSPHPRGLISLSDLAPRIHELRHRQEQLEAAKEELEEKLTSRKMELASPEVVTRYVEDLSDLLSQSPLMERKAFIRSFVKEVLVNEKDVVLTYTIPLPPDGMVKENVEVLPFVRHGGPNHTIGRTFKLAFSLAT